MKTLSCKECLGTLLVTVRIAENDTGQRSTPTRVMDYIFYEAPNVSIALSIVEDPQACGSFVMMGVGLELFWDGCKF